MTCRSVADGRTKVDGAGGDAAGAGAPTRASRAADRRLVWLDATRGIALVAMIVYHGAFDLMFFGWVDWPVAWHPAWRAFAAAIASSFLGLVGVGLVLAHGDGVRWRAFLRRLALIAAAAGAVTVATALAMPVPVSFGILHAIATFSVLALPFVFLPAPLTLAVAAAVLVLPFVWRDPAFTSGWFYPLGLAPTAPPSFDYEPIFPWFAATLAGVAAARLHPPRRAGGDRPAPAALRPLLWMGRRSLLVYLVHQPVLFALLLALARLG